MELAKFRALMARPMQKEPWGIPLPHPIKMNRGIPCSQKFAAAQRLLPALVCWLSILPAFGGVKDDKPITMEEVVVSATKTHTLFMGADFAINLDKDLYPVRDVFGSNWVIEINGQQREISSKQAPVDLKITPTLKLTEVSATIVGFKRQAAYSYENDPSVRITQGLTHAASLNSDLLAVSQNAQARSDTENSHSLGAAALFAGSDDQFSANAMMTTAEFAYSNQHPGRVGPGGLPLPSPGAPSTTTSTTGNSVIPGMVMDPSKNLFINPTQNLNNGIMQESAAAAQRQTANGNEAAGKIATSGQDAMDIEFDISSARPLRNPYVVTITRFHAAGAKPGSVQNLVYARALDPVDSHLSHVHFSEDGFPFNYEVVSFQLHIYDRGIEIATNLSPNRVELTRDEAFEYVKMEYLGAHKGATLPAVAVMGQLPADLPTRVAAGKYGDTFYVRVTKDGFAKGAYIDAGCTESVDDPYVVSIVGKVRFKPALSGGKPVDAVAPLNLSKLTL
jgi:hypothetical protein